MARNSDSRKVSITVVDSGVDTTISDLSSFVSESILININKSGFIEAGNNPAVHHIHGTVVSLVIRDICPNVSIRSINILNNKLTSDGRILLFAMEHALDKPPDIIHLSLGTTHLRYWLPLRSLLKKARRAGTIVVAAADNSGKRSYPAYLRGVVGVKTDPGLIKKSDFYYHSGFFCAPCEIHEIRGRDEIQTRIGGNSTAAAFISGHIAKLLCNKDSLDIVNPVKSLINQGIKNFNSIKELLS